MRDHERGLNFAAALLTSSNHRNTSPDSVSKLLEDIREEFPDFQSMYVTDANWRIIAADPLHHPDGRDVIGINLSRHAVLR